MDEREKIINIIEQTEDMWHEADRLPFGDEYHEIKYGALADALIRAGIGDVKERKFEADHYWRMWQGALVELERAEHRAEVAERALLLMARGECTFASPEFYKEEAEQEVAKEEQIMANRCGEGKCEYFESIRRAANNNRENGYCKKYKQALSLYDWWWLKCDECAAEKEIAEEDKR